MKNIKIDKNYWLIGFIFLTVILVGIGIILISK